MEIHEMYQKINNKDRSCKDFVEFVDFMFRNKDCIHKLENEIDKNNFIYHFNRIPIYLKDMLQKLRYDLFGDITNISVTVERLSERMNNFTNIEKT